MRSRVGAWFQLDETLSFSAQIDCAAGAFRLVDASVGAGLPVETSTLAMLNTLTSRAVAAVDDPAQSPDAAMIEAANGARAQGMAMRRAALEARACMDDTLATEFGRLLTAPAAIFAFDRAAATVMLLDVENRVLVVARGGT